MDECAEGDPHYPARARLIPEAGGDAPLALSWADADAQLAVLFPDAEIKPLPPQPWSLRQHVDEVARLFEGWGFRVVRVPHPAPYLTIERHVYVGPEGGVARRVVRADPVFPTYTNALLVNGRAWVPRYATATPAQNSAAARVYASFGFEVESVDMTEDIAFRGATRCLALEIHGPPAGPA